MPLRFVCIVSSRELKAGRMATRTGHHMSTSLLDSQPAVLELPTAHEDALLLDLRAMVDELIERAVAYLRPPSSGNHPVSHPAG